MSEVCAHANDKRSHKISALENHKELKERLHLQAEIDKVEFYKVKLFEIVFVRVVEEISRA